MTFANAHKAFRDCVNASSVNMFKNRIDISDKGGLHIDEKIVGLSISQWLPCPLAIWNLLFEMAILLNLNCTLPTFVAHSAVHFAMDRPVRANTISTSIEASSHAAIAVRSYLIPSLESHRCLLSLVVLIHTAN